MKGPVAVAARVAVASHAYNMTTSASTYQCSSSACDQVDFARRWSKVLSRYNPDAAGSYKVPNSPPTGKTLADSQLNWVGHRAITLFDVGLAP
jgi:hypothetical protein